MSLVSLVVCQAPPSSLPMAARAGRSRHKWCRRSSPIRSCIFSTNSRVGLGVGAPRSPWQKEKVCTPGICRSHSMIGRRQIDGMVSSGGMSGCSKAPLASTNANLKSISKAKQSKKFPTPTCRTSRRLRENNPQSSSPDRTGRGPLHWEFRSCTKRARLQVSQGGPQRNPATAPHDA